MSASHKVIAGVVLLLALVAGFLVGGGRLAGGNRLTFLSVGQGDCVVIQAGEQTVLVDTGPSDSAGERLIAPKLRNLGVDQIDLVLITHPDADHIGGLQALAKHFEIGAVTIPTCFREHRDIRELLGGPLKGLQVHWLERSAKLTAGDWTLQLEAPVKLPPKQDNDGSVFIRASCGEAVAVLSGDAPIDVELTMLSRLTTWRAQVLQAGHHGSRTSTGAAWLQAVQPEWVVISCGRNNRYDHPHRSVVDAINAAGAKLARTDRDGDVSFDVTPNGLERR